MASDEIRVVSVGPSRALLVSLGAPHDTLSWAIVNGGRRRAEAVVWRQVQRFELGPDVDARAVMRDTLEHLGVASAIGLLTARDVRSYEEARAERGDIWARCVATVGFGNALTIGDPPSPPTTGTINLLCQVSTPLESRSSSRAPAVATVRGSVVTREARQFSTIACARRAVRATA